MVFLLTCAACTLAETVCFRFKGLDYTEDKLLIAFTHIFAFISMHILLRQLPLHSFELILLGFTLIHIGMIVIESVVFTLAFGREHGMIGWIVVANIISFIVSILAIFPSIILLSMFGVPSNVMF